jgi:hypothetical protein
MSRTPKPLFAAGPPRAANLGAAAALGVVSLVAFTLSFHGLSSLAHRGGLPWVLAAGVPVLIDGLQLAASILIFSRTGMSRRARGAWAAIVVSTFLSMLGNAAWVMSGKVPVILPISAVVIAVATPGLLAWTFHMAVGAWRDYTELAAHRFAAVPALLPVQRPMIPEPVAHNPEPLDLVPDHRDHPVDQSTDQVPAAAPLTLVPNSGEAAPADQSPDGPGGLVTAVKAVLDQWTADGRTFGPDDWKAVVEAAPVLAGKTGYARPGREVPKRIAAYLTARAQEKSAA